MIAGWLWIVFTVTAAFFQTLRNAMQRELTTSLGTVGATHVRFLFGFPFALLSLIGVLLVTGVPLPRPSLSFWPWVIDGAGAQIAATALMLMAMGQRSFVVTIAYIKTEPIQVAIFGLIFLGDAVTLPMMTAILVATAGVLIMSFKPGGMAGGVKPTLIGLASGGMFALSAIGYRGAILDLHMANFVMAATFTLVVGLVMQAVVLSLYLWLRQPSAMIAILRAWKPLAVRRPDGRAGLAILVFGLRHRHRRQRADVGPDRGAVRANRCACHVRSAHHRARSRRHGAGRRRRGAADFSALSDRLESTGP